MTAIDWGKVNDMPQDEAILYVRRIVANSDQASGETGVILSHPAFAEFLTKNQDRIFTLLDERHKELYPDGF